ASRGGTGGEELFAVIPNAVVSRLGALANSNYAHRDYVDASPQQADARINGSWKTVLLSRLAGGGSSVIALDVTDPATSFGTSNFLWEFQHEDLGLTYGRPQIALLPDDNWYAIFGSGYNSDSQRAGLFIVNLETGELATASPILVGEGGTDDPNGMGSIAAVD